MSWKTTYRSFYYQDAPEPEDIVLPPAETALLVIDIQNTYLEPKPDPADDARWQPFFERMRETVIPNTAKLFRRTSRPAHAAQTGAPTKEAP
jgi:nicotinamidase-related amidase